MNEEVGAFRKIPLDDVEEEIRILPEERAIDDCLAKIEEIIKEDLGKDGAKQRNVCVRLVYSAGTTEDRTPIEMERGGVWQRADIALDNVRDFSRKHNVTDYELEVQEEDGRIVRIAKAVGSGVKKGAKVVAKQSRRAAGAGKRVVVEAAKRGKKAAGAVVKPKSWLEFWRRNEGEE